jgi:hypothetical protein
MFFSILAIHLCSNITILFLINLPIIGGMKGMTIDEIADELGIPWKTAHKRIETLGIKPLSYKALYDPSVVEQIRNVRMGRPPRKPEAPAKPLSESKVRKIKK